MTHEPLLTVRHVTATGTWLDKRMDAVATLALMPDDAELSDDAGAQLLVPYATLTDATWERETLVLHSRRGVLALRGPRELSRAWAMVVEQACALPEVTRGMRSLGTARGGSAALQARFFGPLLAARRRLQEPDALERRVTQFDPLALTQRLNVTIGELATERHPNDAPRRRSVHAHLEEAVEPLQAQLAALTEATAGVHAAAVGRRFVEWRLWTQRLRRVFLEADRAWSRIVQQLETR